jgi:FAD/FMN-containing dehydrogenase
VAVRPFAYVCHDPTFDADACAFARRHGNESTFLAATPGALQHSNWGARTETGETCYLNTTRNTPCGQGRISLFSAVVRKPAHIQAAVKFASRHNIRLAIKNTGHCYLGRSSAPESLQILTTNMKNISFVDSFRPQGCGSAAKSEGPAVTIAAGVFVKDLYRALGEKNLTAVIGLAHTVGAAGGYIQGGGHSPLGWWKGLAADNALEFTVVTAKVGFRTHSTAITVRLPDHKLTNHREISSPQTPTRTATSFGRSAAAAEAHGASSSALLSGPSPIRRP